MGWKILAPKGAFATVAEAARGEQEVDWSAAEGAEHEVCTLAFAAVEAAEILSRISDVQAEVEAFEGAFPEAPFISVLGPSSFAEAGEKVIERFGEVDLPEVDQSL